MALPSGFVYLADVDPTIQQDMKYLTNDNFLGRPVKGYLAPRCILTEQAAAALATIQQELETKGLGLKVFDCYRPQTAVNDFVAWSEDNSEHKMKKKYYPHISKEEFFTLGYAAKKSSHSRGSTADLTIIELETNNELEMGTIFDFMDPLSHPDNEEVSKAAFINRIFLQQLMVDNGFEPIDTEWWHFTLVDEPYPDTYFDFYVE